MLFNFCQGLVKRDDFVTRRLDRIVGPEGFEFFEFLKQLFVVVHIRQPLPSAFRHCPSQNPPHPGVYAGLYALMFMLWTRDAHSCSPCQGVSSTISMRSKPACRILPR